MKDARADGLPNVGPRGKVDAASDDRPPAVPVAPRTIRSGSWSDRTDVALWRSGLLGLIISGSLLGVLFLLANFYLGELFLERGWVPFVLLFFLGWSIAILLLKWWKIKRQRQSMLFDVLPSEISETITLASADRFLSHISELPVSPAESFLIHRVVRGLEHFESRRSNTETASILASQSEVDANAVESSYTLLNVFIWAIPILGFIGTVIGISQAVGGFSGSLDQAQDIAVLKDSLNGVTSGLATAFDTTLVALVMSMIVMFPSSSLRKAEEDLLNSVDEYCNENLLKRLDGGFTTSGYSGGSVPWDGDANSSRALREAVDCAMAPHRAELTTWREKLEAVGQSISAEVAKTWEKIDENMSVKQAENAERLQEIEKLAGRLETLFQDLSQLTDGKDGGELTRVVGDAAQAFHASFNAASQGLERLNDVLTDLGEKRVVVQTKRHRRRWGIF